MANKAFVVVTSMEATGTTMQLLFRYMQEDPESALVGSANIDSSVLVDYADNAHSLHEKIADKIRNDQEDQTIVVVFFDSPGHY